MHEFQSNSPQRQPRPHYEDPHYFALRPNRGPIWNVWLILAVVFAFGMAVFTFGFFAYQRTSAVRFAESGMAASYAKERLSAVEAKVEAELSRPASVTLDDTFAKLLKNAERASLFEGLPHQQHEAALLKKERDSKKTALFGDFYFYEEALELKDADAEAVRDIVSDPQTFEPYSGGCGSYHPDYLVEWYSEGETVRVYLCFGCGEAKVVGPNGETKYSIGGVAKTKLQNVLFAYHKNRPDSEGWLKMTKDYRSRQQ